MTGAMLKTTLAASSLVFCGGTFLAAHPSAQDAGSFVGGIEQRASAFAQVVGESAKTFGAALERDATRRLRRFRVDAEATVGAFREPEPPDLPTLQPAAAAPSCRLREIEALVAQQDEELVQVGLRERVYRCAVGEPVPPPFCD